MIETKIMERLAVLETKLDSLTEIVKEHKDQHFQIRLLGYGAVLTSIGAVVVALVV